MKNENFDSVDLHLPSVGPVSPACGSLIVHELLKHFLYMRCQIPNVYDELYRVLQVLIYLRLECSTLAQKTNLVTIPNGIMCCI